MAAHAHVVGMTLASECIVAKELGITYTAVCLVDNLANGIEGKTIVIEELDSQRERNAAALRDALGTLLPELEG